MQVTCTIARQSCLYRSKAVLLQKDHHNQQFRKAGHAFSAFLDVPDRIEAFAKVKYHISTFNQLYFNFLRWNWNEAKTLLIAKISLDVVEFDSFSPPLPSVSTNLRVMKHELL